MIWASGPGYRGATGTHYSATSDYYTLSLRCRATADDRFCIARAGSMRLLPQQGCVAGWKPEGYREGFRGVRGGQFSAARPSIPIPLPLQPSTVAHIATRFVRCEACSANLRDYCNSRRKWIGCFLYERKLPEMPMQGGFSTREGTGVVWAK